MIESIAVQNEVAVVGTKRGLLTAVDIDKGEILWQVKGHGNFEPRALIRNGSVYAGSGTWLMKLEALTGDVLWELNLGAFVRDTPLIIDDTIVVRTDDIIYGLKESDPTRNGVN